ncbi:MAG: hypothetical protein RJA70_385 [Pseudomonadota bacterium]|jgi:cell division transport system permease protein
MKTIERAWRGGKSEWRMHGLSTLSTSVAFMCLAFALLAVVNLHSLEQRWQSAGRISAYLAPQVSEAEATEIARVLKSTPDVKSARYVSAESARGELLEASPNTLLEALPGGAFPATVEVQLNEGAPAARAEEVAGQLRELATVESVETYKAWTKRLSHFAGGASLAAGFLALIVFGAVTTVVSSSIKLMLERRRSEVEVLRIVGATSDYVRRPFMVEGAVQGALGALVAVALCGLMFAFVQQRFDEQLSLLFGMAPRFLPWFLCLGLVGSGALLGAVASHFSLRGAIDA